MKNTNLRLAGFELYFEDLKRARDFYSKTLALQISEEQPGHHAKFDFGAGFLCLEQKGAETYRSEDKAVVFFQVSDLQAAIGAIGRERFVEVQSGWAVLPDPEGHSVLLLQGGK